MLSEIKIQNFKCFRDISLALRPLTVLTGINGTGKSSVIQALLALRQSGKPPVKNLVLNGSLVSMGYGQDVLYEYAADDDNIILSVKEDSKKEWNFCFIYDKDGRTLKRSGHVKGELKNGILWDSGFYYLNAERVGPRRSFPLFSESPANPIGCGGEYCAALLNEHADDECGRELCIDTPSGNSLLAQAEARLSSLGRPARIQITPVHGVDSAGLSFSFASGQLWSSGCRASNAGFGLTYVLPVFVSCLLARKGGLVIIENPESHLHPKGQAVLGSFLAHAANSGVQIITETHSDHILNGIRIAVRKGNIKAEDIAVHFFSNDTENLCSSAVSPEIDSSGRINIWPEGFLDEWEKSLLELL